MSQNLARQWFANTEMQLRATKRPPNGAQHRHALREENTQAGTSSDKQQENLGERQSHACSISSDYSGRTITSGATAVVQFHRKNQSGRQHVAIPWQTPLTLSWMNAQSPSRLEHRRALWFRRGVRSFFRRSIFPQREGRQCRTGCFGTIWSRAFQNIYQVSFNRGTLSNVLEETGAGKRSHLCAKLKRFTVSLPHNLQSTYEVLDRGESKALRTCNQPLGLTS